MIRMINTSADFLYCQRLRRWLFQGMDLLSAIADYGSHILKIVILKFFYYFSLQFIEMEIEYI